MEGREVNPDSAISKRDHQNPSCKHSQVHVGETSTSRDVGNDYHDHGGYGENPNEMAEMIDYQKVEEWLIKKFDTFPEEELQPRDYVGAFDFDTPQSNYIHSVLSHTPVTIADFPHSSGKSSSVVMAALTATDGTHLIVTPDDGGSQILVKKFEEQCKNPRISAVRFGISSKTKKDFSVLMKSFMKEVVRGEHNMDSATIQSALVCLEQASHLRLFDPQSNVGLCTPRMWVELFLEIKRPNIVIVAADHLHHVLPFLKHVRTVQFDDANLIHQTDINHVIMALPNSSYGFIGASWTKPTKHRFLNPGLSNLVNGNIIKDSRLRETLPITSTNVYGYNSQILKSLEVLFQRKFTFFGEPNQNYSNFLKSNSFPIKLLDTRGEFMIPCSELVAELVYYMSLQVPEIGLIRSSNNQIEPYLNIRADYNVSMATKNWSRVPQKNVLIAWVSSEAGECVMTPDDVEWVLRKGKQLILLVGDPIELKDHTSWKKVVEHVENNDSQMDLGRYISHLEQFR